MRTWKRGWCVLGVALVVGVAASSACGGAAPRSEAGEGRWEAVYLPMPSGHRASAYDSDRDILWIVTARYTSDSDAVLTEFHPDSREARDHTIAGSTNWLGYGDAVAVDAEGNVWLAWGHRLITFDPRAEEVEERAIPSPTRADPDAAPERGVAVDILIDGHNKVWVARSGLDAVSVLDTVTGTWDAVSSGGLLATPFSQLARRGDGSLFINGVTAPSDWALAVIDPATGEAALSPAHAAGYAVFPDGFVVYVDAVTGEVRRQNGPAGEDVAIGPKFYPVTAENDFTEASAAVWFRHDGVARKDIVHVDPATGEASLFPYPLDIKVFGEDIIPTGLNADRLTGSKVALDPDIQGIAVDKRGDVWVISAADGSSAAYPPLYRLDPGPAN